MTGRVLGEAWHIYKRRFGIMVFFSFVFMGLGYALVYGGQQWVSYGTGNFSFDMISIVVRLVKGMSLERLFWEIPSRVSPYNMDMAAFPVIMLVSLGGSMLSLAYSILAMPIYMGGVTVLSTGATGPLTWRSVFHGVKQRYGKLLATYLCYMVYGMAAGFALMLVYMIAGFLAAIAAPMIIMGSSAGIAAGVVLITLLALLIAAAMMVINTLAVFIMPAAVFDRQYNFKAVGRSISMAWKHFFRVLWVQIAAWLLMILAIAILFGLFFALAWSGPDIPIYTPLWALCIMSLVSPFSVIVNGVLYRHIQEQAAEAQAA